MGTEEVMTEDELDLSELFRESQKKKKSGGFQSMGLSYPVLKGVLRKGYKVPTPIQRKAIPILLERRDVVGMARTGSGKTAAFLVPLLERLKCHQAKQGARGLVLSPTRELATQTLKFFKELARFTGLRASLILGGDKMEDQFASIHGNPDVIIATPGRFLHVVMEMDLKLNSLEYVVLDEADRLFEMGFQEQLQEILYRLPEERQTLLFSATLPKLLVDFAKAGLSDPTLLRLDTEATLSPLLKTTYFYCRSEDKLAVLLHILGSIVKAEEMTVVFLATRHHVEYTKQILEQLEIPCAYVYSSLDQAARKIQVAKFHARKCNILLVTDIAARGIDIPILDNVINVHFPAKPKLFVHRVGRVARAGRTGTAYSIVAPDEVPYLIDLHLFLGKPLLIANKNMKSDTDGVCGSVPQLKLDDELDTLRCANEKSSDLQGMFKVCSNAYKQYIKSRPLPSAESIKRAKELFGTPPDIHLLFREKENSVEEAKANLIANIRNYRPNNTIFEIGATAKSQAVEVMRIKKAYHGKIIQQTRVKRKSSAMLTPDVSSNTNCLQEAGKEQIEETFSVARKKAKTKQDRNQLKKPKSFRDKDYYLPYQSVDHYTDKGMEIDKSFGRQVAKEMLDLVGDDTTLGQKSTNVTKWDRKKKKFVNNTGMEARKNKIRTESGAWMPATYKTNLYKKWKEGNKADAENSDNEDPDSQFGKERPGMKRGRGQNKTQGKRPYKRELKTKEEILKNRKRRETKKFHQKRRELEHAKRRGKK